MPPTFRALPISIMEEQERARRFLPLALLGNALMRIAGGASSVLAGLYLARLANRGDAADASLAGTLGAVSFAGELVFSLPAGFLSDKVRPRLVISAGAVLGAIAVQLFGLTRSAAIFFVSRGIEGLAAACGAPPLLAHITAVTEHDPPLRVKAMSYFELSLLAGLALGGLLGARLWSAFDTGAFASVAAVYLACAVILYIAVASNAARTGARAERSSWRALADPTVRRLAPVWLCVNSIVGLWLGP
ncbi:MAG: MFS transporter, partial [Acidobacteriota bacterium]|nr:MFS transporter [Acidobacteriota bacterium]